MKQDKIFQTLVCIVLFCTLSGCAKEEIFKDIENHWELKQFVIKENNKVVYCERLYFGITYVVTEIAEKRPPVYHSYLARTEYRDNFTKLVLKDIKYRELTNSIPVDATIEQLKPFGIIDPQETIFEIVKLTGKHLILESDYARLELDRF